MKQRRQFKHWVMVLCALVFAMVPGSAIAEQALQDQQLVNSVIITEIQTGGATAGEEFVELYNTSTAPVDITGWQVRYLNALGAGDATVLVATVSRADSAPVMLASHAYYVLHSPTVALPDGVARQMYDASLSKTDKTIALFGRDQPTCQMTVRDAVAWEATGGTTMGEGTPVFVTTQQATKDKLLQRRFEANGEYRDTNNNAEDFVLVAATPGVDNPLQAVVNTPGSLSTLPAFMASDCSIEQPPGPEDPPMNELAPPQLSELLPNPAPPQTDAADEFIELYNPNDEPFNISGYILETGVTTKYRYTFPMGTLLEPQTYRAFMAADTQVALSNTSGQARLSNPDGIIVAQTDPYATASDGKAWAAIDDVWQWTSKLTPNAVNEIELPAEEPEDPEIPPPTPPNSGLLVPLVSELLPNPGAPQTDANDEFIELYNPNDVPFALGGYIVEVGLTTKYRYVIPAGTTIQPRSYLAFFSADTKLAMANSAGQARLIDLLGAVIAQTDPYATAKDGHVWQLLDGIWQWSTKPTPNASNIPGVPVLATKKVGAASVAKKPKAAKKSTKTATTKKPKAILAGNAAQAAVATKTTRDPLHPGVLAAVAGFALLYGAYEYRRDVANKLYQFRSNRAARAAARQSIKGR